MKGIVFFAVGVCLTLLWNENDDIWMNGWMEEREKA